MQGFQLEHLAFATAFAVCGQQPQTVFCQNKGVTPGRTLEHFLIDAFGAMRIKEPHIVYRRLVTRASGATMPNIFLCDFVYNHRISGAHISISTLASGSCSSLTI